MSKKNNAKPVKEEAPPTDSSRHEAYVPRIPEVWEDSLFVASECVNSLVHKVQDQIHLNELDKIKVPYSSKHCIDSGFISLELQALSRDHRMDDTFINDPNYLQDDEEPCPPKCDPFDDHVRYNKIEQRHMPTDMSFVSAYDKLSSPTKRSERNRQNNSQVLRVKTNNEQMTPIQQDHDNSSKLDASPYSAVERYKFLRNEPSSSIV